MQNPTEPRWLQVARAEIGVKEKPGGAAHHPRILEYHATTSLRAKTDEVPWCASFVNWVLKQAGITGTNSAAAISWTAWGKACDPNSGAVVVIRRKAGPGEDSATGSSSGNHVGFLLSVDKAHVRILGGNQSNAVKESLFPLEKYKVLAYRWPIEKEG